MITEKEKKELFDEFKEMMGMESNASRLRKVNFAPARAYFDKMFKKTVRKKPNDYKLEKCNLYIWPTISLIMCRGANVEYVHKVKPALLPIVNEYGTKFADLYFEYINTVRNYEKENLV